MDRHHRRDRRELKARPVAAALPRSGGDIGHLSPRRTEYPGIAAEDVTETTVDTAAVQRRTAGAIDPPDADGDGTNGHQIPLAGLAAITVTAADGQPHHNLPRAAWGRSGRAASPGLTLDLRRGPARIFPPLIPPR